MGEAMLAFQPPEVIEQIVTKIRFVRYTHKTLTSRDALLNALERVRRSSYAIDDQKSRLQGAGIPPSVIVFPIDRNERYIFQQLERLPRLMS
jgi:DNA-binding IclR family transcriptional regulator